MPLVPYGVCYLGSAVTIKKDHLYLIEKLNPNIKTAHQMILHLLKPQKVVNGRK